MKEVAKYSDNELISRYVNGDIRSIEILVARYKAKVYSYIRTLVDDYALVDDIFQETFIKAIQMFRNGIYKDEGKFNQWITTIAHNLIIDSFRKSKRDACVPYDLNRLADDHATYEMSAEDKLIADYNRQQLNMLIDMLPPEQSEVLKLRLYCDLCFKDIAALTGVSINTALGRMRYALINIRKLLKEKNIVLQQY